MGRSTEYHVHRPLRTVQHRLALRRLRPEDAVPWLRLVRPVLRRFGRHQPDRQAVRGSLQDRYQDHRAVRPVQGYPQGLRGLLSTRTISIELDLIPADERSQPELRPASFIPPKMRPSQERSARLSEPLLLAHLSPPVPFSSSSLAVSVASVSSS